MTESIKKPIKSKTAQLRADYRKHQRRLAFWQPLPAVLFSFAVAGGFCRQIYGDGVAALLVIVFLALALAAHFYVRHLKNDKSIVPFDDIPHAADGVCPDCGGHLAFAIDEKALRRKNFTAHLVAWGFSLLPIVNISVLAAINPTGEIYTILAFAPLLFILALPFLLAFDKFNRPRMAVCRACGFDEPVGFDLAATQRNVALKVMERFWLPVFRFKWWIVVTLTVAAFALPFVFDDALEAFGLLLALPVILGFLAFFVGACNVKFYESYFDVPAKPSDKMPEEKPKPDAANIDHATPAPNI